eukprot:SAG25_NODE_35_length_20155_cov_35.583815_11_plen_431_part_00
MAVVSCLRLILLNFLVTSCNDVSVMGSVGDGLSGALAGGGVDPGVLLRPPSAFDPLTGAASPSSAGVMPGFPGAPTFAPTISTVPAQPSGGDGGSADSSPLDSAAAYEAMQQMQYLRYRQAEAVDPVAAAYQQQVQYMQYLMALDAATESSTGDNHEMSLPDLTSAVPSAYMPGVHELDRWTVDNYIGRDQAVFLQFYAEPTYCPVCLAMTPEMHKLGELYGGEAQLVVAKTDAQAQLPLAERFDVVKMMLPAVLFFPIGSTEPEVYEGAADHISLSQFLESRLEGLTKDGQVRQMRPIIKQFAAAQTREESQAARDAAADAAVRHYNASEDGQLMAGQIDRYVAVMDRVLKRGKAWLSKQRESLVRKCSSLEQDSSAQKKAQRQLNVLDEFVQAMNVSSTHAMKASNTITEVSNASSAQEPPLPMELSR